MKRNKKAAATKNGRPILIIPPTRDRNSPRAVLGDLLASKRPIQALVVGALYQDDKLTVHTSSGGAAEVVALAAVLRKYADGLIEFD